MSISSIFTQAGSALSSINASQAPLAASTSQSSSDGDSTDISQLSQLMSELQQMSVSDPSEFEQVTGSIATQLQQAAQQQGGSAGNWLSNLAQKFQTASQTGNMSSLETLGHHGGHHHGGGGGGLMSLLSSSSSSSSPSSTASSAASAYSNTSSQSVFSQLMNIIGQALSSQTTSGSS